MGEGEGVAVRLGVRKSLECVDGEDEDEIEELMSDWDRRE